MQNNAGADRHAATGSLTSVTVGRRTDGTIAEWDFNSRSNFNGLFIGASGSGKTYRLQNVMAPLAGNCTFHVLDVKDDFRYENFVAAGLGGLVSPEMFNDINLGYVDGDSGINILQFSRSIEAGGVYMAVQEAIQVIKMFKPDLGSKMLAYLTELLHDLYDRFEIYHDDPASWQKRAPSILDLLNLVEKITVAIRSGLSMSVLDELEKIRRRAAKEDKDTDKFHECCDEAAELLGKYGKEVCIGKTKYYSDWNMHSLHAIRETLRDMVKSQLFTRTNAQRVRGKINRYCIAQLHPTHQQIMFRIVLSQVFSMSVMETISTGNFNPKFPRHLVVCDEGKHVKQIAKSDMSPINRIATEGRGYGCGVLAGVQRIQHVTDDMAANFNSVFMAASPHASYPQIQKNFGVNSRQLSKLIPQKNFLFLESDGKYSLVD